MHFFVAVLLLFSLFCAPSFSSTALDSCKPCTRVFTITHFQTNNRERAKKMEWNQRNNEIIRSSVPLLRKSSKWLELNYRCKIISVASFYLTKKEMRMCTTQQFLALAPFKHLFAFVHIFSVKYTLLLGVCMRASALARLTCNVYDFISGYLSINFN